MRVRYRVTATPQASGYSEAGASYKRRALRAFFPNSNSPSSDIHDNADILRQRSRMLYMSAPVATSAINTNRTKIVGTGLTLKATVDRNVLGLSPEKAKEWQSKTEAEFRLWAENRRSCDAMGLNDFYGLQQLALKSWLMSGDVFAVVKIRDPDKLHPYGLRLHLVEADRVSTPDKLGGMLDGLGYTEGTNPNTGNKIYDGVEVDSSGMIVAYHVRNTYPHEWRNDITKWQRVEAVGATTGLPQILHIMESERPDQYRGVPLIAPIIEPLLQLRRYTESELLAALVQSFFTAWIVTDTPKNAIPFDETGSGDLGGVPVDNPKADNASHSPNEYEMGPGTVAHLGKGEDIKFGNPNIPTAGFDTFVKTLCKLMGGAIEMPYELLLKEFNASYGSISGQYALWDSAEKVVSTSAASINNALQSQITYWDNYNQNLEKLNERAADIDGLSEAQAGFAKNHLLQEPSVAFGQRYLLHGNGAESVLCCSDSLRHNDVLHGSYAGCYRTAGSQRTCLCRWCGQHNSDENDYRAARNYPRQGCVCTGACIWQTCADL